MTDISQTTFWNAFSWMKIRVVWLILHWNQFLRAQFTICQHWSDNGLATSHHLNQWKKVLWCTYASLGLNELRVTPAALLVNTGKLITCNCKTNVHILIIYCPTTPCAYIMAYITHISTRLSSHSAIRHCVCVIKTCVIKIEKIDHSLYFNTYMTLWQALKQ